MRFLFTILLFFVAVSAKAQNSFSASVSGSATVYAIQSLTITGGSLIPNFTSLDHYLNGVTAEDYLSIGVKSNKSWTLSINAQNAFFSPMSSGGSTNMPCSVLSIKTSMMGNFLSVSTTAQTLKTGNKGNLTTPGNSFDVDIKYNPGFSYKGGIYTLGLVYTLSQQ
ncbi:MAG TPA: hypothetical protein PL009_13440 [Flavipsychrobacter sp.]|nr:hypothetical protein [Flavipsychrobacter sp.]